MAACMLVLLLEVLVRHLQKYPIVLCRAIGNAPFEYSLLPSLLSLFLSPLLSHRHNVRQETTPEVGVR